MTDLSTDRASALWITLLTAASTATALVLACATPFPALAAIAAVHLRTRAGFVLLVAAWVIDQVIGFGFRGYPQDAATLLTGCAIGTAAVASVAVARLAVGGMAGRSDIVRLTVAYVAGFVAFKAAIALWTPVMGHADAALSVEIMLRQFARNGAILVGLVVLYRGLTAVGVPSAARAPLAA